MLHLDVIFLIAEHVHPHPYFWMKLSEVSKDFYTVFTSDKVWERFNVYGLKEGIYRHFLEDLKPVDKRMFSRLIDEGGGFGHRPVIPPVNVDEDAEVSGPWYEGRIDQDTFDLMNLYTYLMVPTFPAFHTDRFKSYEVPYAKRLVALNPGAYASLPSELRNNREIAFAALHQMDGLCSGGLEDTQFYNDLDFCLEVVRGMPQPSYYHSIEGFSPELENNPLVRETISQNSPDLAVLYAPNITQEIVNKFFPTEEYLLPYIETKGDLLVKFLPFYSSPKLIVAALGSRFNQSQELCNSLTQAHLEDPTVAEAYLRHFPERIDNIPPKIRGHVRVALGILDSVYFCCERPAEGARGNHQEIFNKLPPKLRDPEFVLKMIRLLIWAPSGDEWDWPSGRIECLLENLSFLNFKPYLSQLEIASTLVMTNIQWLDFVNIGDNLGDARKEYHWATSFKHRARHEYEPGEWDEEVKIYIEKHLDPDKHIPFTQKERYQDFV